MKRSGEKVIAVVTCFLLVVLVGCVPVGSLYPLWSEESLVFEPALVGTWVVRDKPGGPDLTLRFTQEGDRAYRMSFFTRKPDKDNQWAQDWSLEFDAHLVRLSGTLFLDLYPSNVAQKQKKAFELDGAIFVHRVHTFYRVKIEGDRLILAYLDDDWVKRTVEEKNLSTWLVGNEPGGDFLLVAATGALQHLLAKNANNPDAFGSIEPFIREK